MRTLSVGTPSTLGSYLKLCKAKFGEKSAATKYIEGMIAEHGEDEEVIKEETQMVYLLTTMHCDDRPNRVQTPNY